MYKRTGLALYSIGFHSSAYLTTLSSFPSRWRHLSLYLACSSSSSPPIVVGVVRDAAHRLYWMF
ncbi:uncharacterized protein LACBIDRAFT_299658 [Laccaria bicolor S238N-H82]|uniref:Predicted protein n=1 Tax=Laccaria bicolor (strain S238N-H82 / ATCC MYA-4686) TaxID=486041 RepID=B0DF40_LACBS|nr:uncharacterized protein LACBIDRAFT_299658 [Laccaria bicolor S238N-H82]EDR06784.1 predicted protein [Laccaria bicolor S238N-H82]|eukprot:XP_001882631.1 predicted protein [Laccaria bicolor S238N-H82]